MGGKVTELLDRNEHFADAGGQAGGRRAFHQSGRVFFRGIHCRLAELDSLAVAFRKGLLHGELVKRYFFASSFMTWVL